MDTGHGLRRLECVTETILHHAHDTMGILGAVSGVAADVLIAKLGSFGIEEALLGRQGRADTAGEVGHDLILVVDVVTGETATGVGEDLVGNPLAGGELHTAIGAHLTGGEDELGGLDNVAELAADVGLLGNVVHIGDQRGLGGNNLGDSRLAAGVGMTMVMCEHEREITGIAAHALVVASTHEHAVIGDKGVVEDGEGLDIADLGERSLNVLALVVQTGQRHQLNAVPVGGQRERHGIVGIVRAHELRRQSNNLVDIGSAGVADLRAAHDNALAGLAVHADTVHIRLDDVEELVGVGLHVGAFILGVTGALHVRLRTVADEVVFLAVGNVLEEALVVLRAAGRVAVKGHGIERVHRVRAHAALHTTADAVADKTGHELLLEQILLRVVDVGGAVDDSTLHTGDVGLREANIRIAGVIRRVVALLHDVSAADDPVREVTSLTLDTVGAVELLTVQVYVRLHSEQTSLVLLIGSDILFRHFLHLL